MKKEKFSLKSFIGMLNYSSSRSFESLMYSLYSRILLTIFNALSPSCSSSVYKRRLLKLEWKSSDTYDKFLIYSDFMMRWRMPRLRVTLYMSEFWSLGLLSKSLPKKSLIYTFTSAFYKVFFKIQEKKVSSSSYYLKLVFSRSSFKYAISFKLL